MKPWHTLVGALLLAFSSHLLAAGESVADLKPLMAVPDKVVLQQDFSKPSALDRQTWAPRQGTRWSIAEGVLRGIPSTPEHQAARKDHKGLEPRLSVPATPPQFIAKFSVRFTGSKETAIVPFVEFGHHVCRLKLSEKGSFLLADGETLRVGEVNELKYEPGKWYHMLAEMKGDEVVIQTAGYPVLYAKFEGFAKPVTSGGAGVGFAGLAGGTVEIDNVTLWSVKPAEQSTWAKRRSQFPSFSPVKEEKGKKR